MNPSAEETLGYASREARGHPLESILVGAEATFPALVEAQQHDVLQDLGSATLYRRNGQAFPAQIRTLPLLMDGRVESQVVFVRDLSEAEQFRTRTQILEERANLGEVMAVFAHEARNPINNVSTGLQLMASSLPPDDPSQQVIIRLQQDCDRLAHLMKSLLNYARPIEYKMEPVALGELIQRLLDRWRAHLGRVNVRSHLQLEPGTPPALGDARALEQVFTNLISNAVQAMREGGGALTVKLRPVPPGEATQVEVSVSDTGIGIPEEIRDRIFQPFFTTNKNGTGLGLSITKRIVTAHKGVIQVTSVPGGTVFQVRLPAAKNEL